MLHLTGLERLAMDKWSSLLGQFLGYEVLWIWPKTVILKLTYIRASKHTYLQKHSFMHTYIQIYIRTYIHTFILTYIHIYIHTFSHTNTRTHINTYVHTYITYIHIYIKYTHTYILTRVCVCVCVCLCVCVCVCEWVSVSDNCHWNLKIHQFTDG